MELQLGLALSVNGYGYGYESGVHVKKKMKRCFEFDTTSQESVDDHVPETLALLGWNNSKLVDEDDNSSSIINKSNEGDENVVIGWPPIKYRRKNLGHQKHGNNDQMVENVCGRGSNSMYVKVKMEGVGIARKIDLSLHHSYHTLTYTLLGMFGKCQKNVNAYKLTYQDKEGDWLLAGDVPWGTFTRSVQRLKLIRKDS